MKTLQKDGRTLKPEDIYLDLSKLSEEEREIALSHCEHQIAKEIFSDYLYMDYSDNEWFVNNNFGIQSKTEITYPEFLQLFGESELTELPEEKIQAFKNGTWFIRGGEDLKKLFKEKAIYNIHQDYINSGFSINENNCWVRVFFEGRTEITVADYKRLTQENEKTCADLGSNAQEKVETCKENLQMEETLDPAEMEADREVADAVDTLTRYEYFSCKAEEFEEKAREYFSKNGFFVFPKAPEGEFPDLSGFEGPLMNVYDGDGEERDLRVIAKYTDDSLGYHFISEVIEHWKYIRPIQKQPITPTELFERLSKYEDLSNYEKPV